MINFYFYASELKINDHYKDLSCFFLCYSGSAIENFMKTN